MNTTLRYIGAQHGWPEIAYTGKQSTWHVGQQEERDAAEAALLLATGQFERVGLPLSPVELLGASSMVAAAGVGGSAPYTREQLRLLAEASGLTPGATYRTVEGVIAYAKTARYLESANWFQSVTRWNAGNATAWKNAVSLMMPPINAAGGGGVDLVHGGICTATTRTKRVQITLGGTLTDAPGTAGVNEYAFNRLLNTTSQMDWETTTRLRCMNGGIVRARSEGNSGEGVGSSQSRYFALDLSSSRLLRVALTTSQSTPAVAVTGLQASGGYAYGQVAAGTFTDASVVRTAQMAGATGGDASIYNLNPIDVELLSAGLPNPALAAVNTTAANIALITNFRYPLSAVPSGAAAGSPTIQLFDELALEHLRVAIYQGAGA